MAGAGETLHPIDTLPASPCPGVKGALQAGLTVGLCPRTPLASCSSAALCLRRGGTSTTTPSSLTKTLNPKTLNPKQGWHVYDNPIEGKLAHDNLEVFLFGRCVNIPVCARTCAAICLLWTSQ